MSKFLISILLFLPTTAFFSSYIYFLFVPVFFFEKRQEISFSKSKLFFKSLSKKKYFSFGLVVLLLLGYFLNSIISQQSIKEIIFGPIFLFPLTLISSYIVSDYKIYRLLLFYISIEVLIGIVQYFLGLNSFFTFLPKFYEFTDYSSLYHTRVFGLSDNSSYLAQKALLGIIILYFSDLKFKNSHLLILYFILVLGIILSFGRTVIVVFLFTSITYLFIYLIEYFFNRKLFDIKYNHATALFISFLLFLFVFSFSFWKNQFNRYGLKPAKIENLQINNDLGILNIEMSGRQELWFGALDFIMENPITGNFSKRYTYGNKHVHNSFLEFAASNGIILFSILMCFIFININFKNILFISSIFIYSIGQFGIFWDISFLDILFYSFLLFNINVFNKRVYR